MYLVDTDERVRQQIDALPAEALLFFAELTDGWTSPVGDEVADEAGEVAFEVVWRRAFSRT